jgi:ribose-phosphate pyrophosphokinase
MNKDLIVLLPDSGAYKWGIKIMDKLKFSGQVLACAKNRYYKEGKSTLNQQLPDFDFTNKSVLIIDDICVYGGTFKGLAKMLKDRNCGKLYLAISHLTVQNHKGDDSVFSYFDKVFTTNSKFSEYFVANKKNEPIQPKNLEVVKLFI